MATIAKISTGTLLKVGDGTTPTEIFTTVPEVTRLSGPAVRFDFMDASSHDTVGNFKEWIPGFGDGDLIRAAINWRPSNTIHKNLRIAFQAATHRNFMIVFPDTSDNTVLVSTFIESLNPNADVNKLLTADLSLKITGAPTWS